MSTGALSNRTILLIILCILGILLYAMIRNLDGPRESTV